ncbi:MAG: BACON domain-containing protein [Alistipes sp.]|nr:BACON domain-containing protein [Alistipes sp.]
MRIFNYFKLFAAFVVVAMAVVACTESIVPEQPNNPNNPENPENPNDPEDPKDPEDPNKPEEDKVLYLELVSEKLMNFPAEGGDGELEWNIIEKQEGDDTRTSPVEPETSTEQEWIKIHPTQRKSFTVEANEGEARDGKITITYREQTIEVIIKQVGKGEAPKPDVSFTIDVQEVHAASAITQVTPSHSDVYYVMFLDEVSYFKNGGITTAEQIWEDDYVAFEGGAIDNNMNLKDYMVKANIVFQGDKRVKWNSVRPGTQSVLYVYAVEFSEDGASYEPISDIAWATIQPEYAPLQDVKFNLGVEVDGAEIKLDVKPENWDGYYLVKVVDANNELYVGEGVEFDSEYMSEIADEWIGVYSSNLRAGHTMQQILDNVCYKGDMVLDMALSSYVLYSALVYPVAEYDGFVQVVGEPSFINFSTEEVGKSDMAFDIEVTNCYVRVADLKIAPSNPDESYLFLITPTEYLPVGYDDDILLEYALGDFYYYTYNFKGEMTTHLNTLYPDKEYVVVVFGYSGGIVTTDVCTKVFKTQKEGKCELEVTDVVVGGPYRVSDLYAYDPETFEYYKPPYYYDSTHFVITMEVKTSEPTTDIFSDFIYKSDYDYHGYDLMFYDLLIDTCEPYYVTTVEWQWTDTDIFANCYACAAAFDYKGDVTPMWMSDLYEWTTDDYRPVEEFIEKYESQPNLMVMGVGVDGSIKPLNKLRK